MSTKLMDIEVKGKHKTWSFEFYADPKYLAEWRNDGLEVSVIENVIPQWVVEMGWTKVWCFAQDIFYFRNPLR